MLMIPASTVTMLCCLPPAQPHLLVYPTAAVAKTKAFWMFSLLYGVRAGIIPRNQQPRERPVLSRLCLGLDPVWVGGPQLLP